MKKYAIKILALCTMERKDARDAVLSEKGESISCEKGEYGRDNNVIHQPRLVHIGKKTVPSVLVMALGCVQDLRHSFSQYGPPAGE